VGRSGGHCCTVRNEEILQAIVRKRFETKSYWTKKFAKMLRFFSVTSHSGWLNSLVLGKKKKKRQRTQQKIAGKERKAEPKNRSCRKEAGP
jgi:hypothetical protein